MTVTITEMENGFYSFPLSTSHSDTAGILTIVFTHGSAKQINLQFRVHARLPDDLAYPTVTGRSIDVTTGGAVGIDWGNIENPSTVVDLSGTDINLVDTTTTNTDMRGTDNALLASSAPTNFGDLAITVTTGQVTVGTNNDKAGYSISGTITTLDGLNDLSAAEINAEVDTALEDIKLDHLVAVADADDPVDGSIIAEIVSATGDWSTFVPSTDSLQALRDRGDAAWTTGAGGTPPQLLQSTTIATLASQTSFTLTAGSADDDAYNGAFCVITDASTSTQKAVGVILDYTGSTRTVTLDSDPGIFTMAVTDTIDILATSPAGSAPTAAQNATELLNRALSGHTIAGSVGKAITDIEADTSELQSDDVPGLIAAIPQPELLQRTTITGLSSQTVFNLTAGSADNDAYIGATAIITDAVTSEQKTCAAIGDYVGATKTITLSNIPIFTIANGDSIDIVAAAKSLATATAVTQVDDNLDTLILTVGTAGAGLTDLGGMSTAMKAEVNAEVDTAISDAALATAANLATVDTVVDGLATTLGVAGAGLTDLGGMSTSMKAEVNAEADTAISDAALATAANLATVDTVVDGLATTIGTAGDGLTALPISPANVTQVSGSATAADRLEDAAEVILAGTASGTPTTTTMVSNVTVTVDDQFNGRTIIFKEDTTTAALRGQATDITGCTASTDTLTFTALTTAPVSGDTFVIH